ncbi:MAG: ATP-grasp domain-containing protein [Planctomycetaceae bacterium]|nr:ATP-grasp domain-containing protein [Planctomycetaceae bacterium]
MDGMLRIEEQLAERGIKVMLPERQSYLKSKKQTLSKLVEECGFRTPRTMQAVEPKGLMAAVETIGFPMMIKGPFYGADKVQSREALLDKFNCIIRDWGGPVILQECIKGQEFNVIAVGDGKGSVDGYCSIRKTVVSEKGKGYGGITIRDSRLDEISLGLIKHLNWRGPLELEFIKDDITKDFLLIEINPRFPAWVDFPSQIGQNLPAQVVRTLLNQDSPVLPECEPGKFFVRHSVDLVGSLDQLEQLSTLGELIAEKPRQETAGEENQIKKMNHRDVKKKNVVNGYAQHEVLS